MEQRHVEKQKWFQQIQQSNMIKYVLLNVIFPIIAVGGVIMAVYGLLTTEDPRIKENLRIADSLRIENIKYQKQYDSVLTVIQKLDSAIANREERIRIIKDTFIIYKTPPFNNLDSAAKFLKEFIEE